MKNIDFRIQLMTIISTLHSAENPHQGWKCVFFFLAISNGEASGIGRLLDRHLVSAMPAECRFVVRLFKRILPPAFNLLTAQHHEHPILTDGLYRTMG
ncbi:hypothetical protein CEXT_326171 [Caerostris extrusa]|uniref:Uncharacterized protein n=1 Tax=Caerostris extrusa TaxID=172846 RepID=A0AAV4PFP6_CAEEX|nr:hypothetical protein CEXT_326171 [Caerostris extrusa]